MGRKMKPFAYAVYVGEDDRQNIFLQFDHPEMCGQEYKKVIPLFERPIDVTDEEIKQLYENSFDWDKRNLWTFNYNDFAKAILRKAQEK